MIAALLAAAALLWPAAAADLDGRWCRDGHSLTIAGAAVTLDDGRRFVGAPVVLAPPRRPGPGLLAALGLDRPLPQPVPVRQSPETTLALGTDGTLWLMGYDFGAPPASGPLQAWSRCDGPAGPTS